MKPVVTLPLDKTPDPSDQDESDGENPPIGDIAELTQRVQSSTPNQNQANEASQSSARIRVFTTKKAKNKGVGKGQSGSSGPPAPKKKATATVSRPAPPSSSESDDNTSSDDDAQDAVGAVQQITVKSKRGYTHYPAYIFDNPPKKLKTDILRKKLMISEIKRSETQTEFYERGMVLMGHLKEFMRNISMSGFFAQASTSQKNTNAEHAYAMQTQEESDEDNESNRGGTNTQK